MRDIYLTAKISNMDIIILFLFINPFPPFSRFTLPSHPLPILTLLDSFKIFRFCYILFIPLIVLKKNYRYVTLSLVFKRFIN